MGSAIMVMKQVSPETPRPYRLIEVYLTSEGPRTRVCSGTFTTLEQALHEQTKLMGRTA